MASGIQYVLVALIAFLLMAAADAVNLLFAWPNR